MVETSEQALVEWGSWQEPYRPFLAPLYALSSRMANTSFTELPMAVRLALEFFAEWLAREPMRALADPPGVAGEVFRVDAMASDQGIRIGGWETFHSTDPWKARWFSVELTRQNCPWLYVRGEPSCWLSHWQSFCLDRNLDGIPSTAGWFSQASPTILPMLTSSTSISR